MKCIICDGPADKISIYVAGEKTQLIIGTPSDGKERHVVFGICSQHLDEEGDFLEGVESIIRQRVLSKVREPGVPEFDGLEQLNEFLKKDKEQP